jgi:hypothetical protein
MKGYIYIIRSHQTTDVYYGSTKQRLSQRMTEHRSQYKRYINGEVSYFRSVNHILKYNDAYIELIEEIEYKNKQELIAREGFFIRNNSCINKEIAGRTQKEWCNDNKEHISIYCKEKYKKKKELNKNVLY